MIEYDHDGYQAFSQSNGKYKIINGMKTDQPPLERNRNANQKVTLQPL